MDSEVLTLNVDINDNPLNEKVESIEKKITELKGKASNMLSNGDTSAVPSFLEDSSSIWRTLQNNLDNIVRTRKSIDNASNSFEKDALIHSFKRQVETANRSLASLFNSNELAKGLSESLGQELSNAFSQSIRAIAPQFTAGLKETARQLTLSNTGPQSDARIVDQFMQGSQFGKIVAPLRKSNPQMFSDTNMRKYLMASMPSSVPQWYRGDVVNGLPVSNAPKPESFRGMLPAAFQKIPTKNTEGVRNLNAAGSVLLTQAEQEKLYQTILRERFAADNAVAAGIVSKRNGRFIFNPNTTRDMVNAMGGFAMQDAVLGARGERKYGILDVEDPAKWANIQKKGNAYITGALSTMRSLQDIFGEWLDPGYYKGLTPFTQYQNGVDIGPVRHSPKIGSRAFAEYTLQSMANGWQINGENPIVNGRVLTGVTAPMKANSKGNPLTNQAINPSDWHTTTLRESMLNSILESTEAGDKPGHNGFSRNAIYMKLDERLEDPYVSEEVYNDVVRQYAERFREGYTVNGEHHSFTRANKTHAEFIPDKILRELGAKQKAAGNYSDMDDLTAGVAFLRGGVGLTQYEDYERFAKDQNVANTMATEGENILSYMGATKAPKVVVGNFSYTDANGEKHKLLDGSNIISNRLSTQSFQGRGYGDKATFEAVNMAGLRALYPELIRENAETEKRIAESEAQFGRKLFSHERAGIIQGYGDMVIPGAGVHGGELVIPWDTDIIEDVANIKSYETGLKHLTQEELNASRSKTFAENPLYAKTTYDDAKSSSRWISNQLVAAMNGGFNDPEVGAFFQQVFEDELLKLNDEQYVRQALFGGDQTVDLTTPEAQKVVLNHQNQLFQRWNRGERLMPPGTFNYQMAAPNVASVINRMKELQGMELSADQRAIGTPTDSVMSLDTLAEMLGVVRFPATGEGNISAVNMANDPVTGEKVRKLADQLGLDPKGLYFNPESPMLKALQGEDFDGDLNGVFELAKSHNPRFAEIMQKVFRLSQDKYQQVMDASNRTDAQQEYVRSRQTKTVESRDNHPEQYDPSNMDDVAKLVANGQKVGTYMGASSGLILDAWQHPITEAIARGIRDSHDMSDVMSVANKKGKIFKQTDEQWDIQNGGHEFGRIFNWASKAATIEGENEDSTPVWTGVSQKNFNAHHIDELNLPSSNVRSTFDTLVERMIQRRKGMPIDLLDDEGNRVFNWDTIFAGLPEIKNPDSWTGKMTARLRDLKKGILNSDFLLPSQEAVDEIRTLKDYAYGEIEDEVAKEGLDPKSGKGLWEVNKRFRHAGGEVARNLTDENGFIATATNALNDPYMRDTIGQLQGLYPDMELMAPAAGYTFVKTDAQREQLVQETEKLRQEEQRLIEEQRQGTTKKKPVTISISDKLPPEAADNFDTAQAAMLANETPQDEARRLLEEAGIKGARLEALMDLPQTTLADAINNDDWKMLKTEGVAQKTATKAIAALKGSRIANIKTTPDVSLSHIADETVKIGEEIEAQTEQQKETLEQASPELQEIRNKISNNVSAVQAYDKEKERAPLREQAFAEFSQLMGGATEFSTNLWSNLRKKENILNAVPPSLIEFEKNKNIAAAYTRRLTEFKESESYNLLSPSQQQQIERLISGDNSLNARAAKDFGESGLLKSQDIVTGLETAVSKSGGTYDAQIESLDQWQKKIDDVSAAQQKLLEMSSDSQYTDKQQEMFKDQAEQMDKNIKQAKEYKEALKQNYISGNEKRYDKQISDLEERLRPSNKYAAISKQYGEKIAEIRESLTQKKEAGMISNEAYEQDMERLDKLGEASSATRLAIDDLVKGIGGKVTQIARMFGRQIFHQALNEAKKFVKEYDKAMTEIQMITLKSDEEITQLGKGLINKALGTGTTVSDVTSAASNLYRQGLSDEEVDARLDDVLKFSKVAGIKTDEASKIITTALQNDLVANSTEAMDALVALGDTAATTASEIAKGMQKAAASAKQAGMSYGELVTLLTIGTSKTQLGGSTIGTALNTMIYRMYKVSNGSDFTDENGRHIASNDVTKALATMGIDIYDENGNFRGPYQILQDIASGWEGADDTTQSLILSTLGAGRQRSNIATLLQGMAADNGEIAGRYLSTAENSKGITDKKFDNYLDSLEAKMNMLKTSWDQLIEGFSLGDAGSGIISFITNIIQGLTAANEATQGWITTLPALTAGIAALSLVLKNNPLGWLITGLAAVTMLTGLIGNAVKEASPENVKAKQQEAAETRFSNYKEGTVSDYKHYTSLIEETKELIAESERLGDAFDEVDAEKLNSNIKELQTSLPGMSSAVDASTASLEDQKAALVEIEQALEAYKNKNIEVAEILAKGTYAGIIEQAQEKINQVNNQYAMPEEQQDATYYLRPRNGTVKLSSLMNENALNPQAAFASGIISLKPKTEYWQDEGRPEASPWPDYEEILTGLSEYYLNGDESILLNLLNRDDKDYANRLRELYDVTGGPDAGKWYAYSLVDEETGNLNKDAVDSFARQILQTAYNNNVNGINLSRFPYELKDNIDYMSALHYFRNNGTIDKPESVYDAYFGQNDELILENANRAYESMAPRLKWLYENEELPDSFYIFGEDYKNIENSFKNGFSDITDEKIRNNLIADLKPKMLATYDKNSDLYQSYETAKNSLLTDILKDVTRQFTEKNPFGLYNEAFDDVAKQAVINAVLSEHPDWINGGYNSDQMADAVSSQIKSYTEGNRLQYLRQYNTDALKYKYNDELFETEEQFVNAVKKKAAADYDSTHPNSGYDYKTGKINYENPEVLRLAEEFGDKTRYISDLPKEQQDIEIEKFGGSQEDYIKAYYDRDRDKYIADAVNKAKGEYGTDFFGMISAVAATQKYSSEAEQQKQYANDVVESLSSEGITNLSGLFEAVKGEKVENWDNLIKLFPELAVQLQKFTETVEEGGEEVTRFKEGLGEDTDLFAQILELIRGASSEHADETYRSRESILSSARKAQEAYAAGKEPVELFKDEYETVVGKELASKRATPGAEWSSLDDLYEQARLANYEAGIESLTDRQRYEGMQQILDAAKQGNLTELAQQTSADVYGAYASGIDETWLAAQRRLEAAGIITKSGELVTMENIGDLDIQTEAAALAEANKELQGLYKNTKEAGDATKQVKADVSKTSLELNKYAKTSSNLATALGKLKKGGKDASEGAAMIRQNFKNMQDQMSAVQKAKGKSGSELKKTSSQALGIIAGMFDGISEQDIAKMTKEELSDLLEGSEEAINETFSNDLQAIWEDAISDIPGLDLSQIKIYADGSLDLSGLDPALQTAVQAAFDKVKAYAGDIAELGFVTEEGETISLKAIVNPKKSFNGGGGGGGGGGKSATDKAIEDAKHKVTQQQHEIKMLEIQQQHLQAIGDYQGQQENLDKQIAAQEELKKIYEQNINDLKAQLAGVKEFSDEWYKLRDAINEAEEALAGINNTVADLELDKFKLSVEQADKNKKQGTHRTTMLEAYGRRSKAEGNFQQYLLYSQKQIDSYDDKIAQNEEELQEDRKRLKKEKQGSALWQEMLDRINALEEENAQLAAQKVEEQNALNVEKVTHIGDELQKAMADETHANTISGSVVSFAQSHKLFDAYRRELVLQNTNNNRSAAMYRGTIQQLNDQMSELEEYSEGWFAARDAIYSYEEALASLTAAIDENNRAIQESMVEQIDYEWGKEIDDAEHNRTMIETELEKYQLIGDNAGYANRLKDKLSAANDVQSSRFGQLIEYQRLWDSGKITDQTIIDDLSEKIETLKEEISKNTNEIISIQQELNAAEFKNFMDKWNKEEANRQHLLNDVRYEETKYQNRGELTNYRTMLQRERYLLGGTEATEGEEASFVDKYGFESEANGGERQALLAKREELQRQLANILLPENALSVSSMDISSITSSFIDSDAVKDYLVTNGSYAGGSQGDHATEGYDEDITTLLGMFQTSEGDFQQLLEKIGNSGVIDIKTAQQIYDELLKTDEQIQKNANDLEKLDEMIKKVDEDIRKAIEAVENDLNKEMKAREAKRREMLSAEVSIQNSILEEIKKRYREEWQLIQKDIQKRKEALNEEKKLLNERLQARKDAQKAEDKENELAELRRQYALISTDQSRTKDAQDLLRRIEEMEKEISWDQADEILQAQSEAIDEQIAQLDEYTSSRSKNLDEMLKDNRRFTDKLKAAMGSKDEYIAYMRENDENYKYATDESRQQMEQGWEDIWNKYMNTPVTYWQEIADMINNGMTREQYIEYMKSENDVYGGNEYKTASDTMKQSYEYMWGERYDKMVAAMKDELDVEDTGKTATQIFEVVSDMSEWTEDSLEELKDVHTLIEDFFNLNAGYLYEGENSLGTSLNLNDPIDHSEEGKKADTDKTDPSKEQDSEGGDSGSGSGDSEKGSYHYKYVVNDGKNNKKYESGWTFTSADTARQAGYGVKTGLEAEDPTNDKITLDVLQSTHKYKKGGLADYTGYAWVDGTKSNPEAFLSATDTKLMRAFLDAFDTVSVPSFSSWDSSKNPTTNNSIGDVYVTINEAEINNDMDIQTLARQVGAQFTKELSKSGFTTANYAW